MGHSSAPKTVHAVLTCRTISGVHQRLGQNTVVHGPSFPLSLVSDPQSHRGQNSILVSILFFDYSARQQVQPKQTFLIIYIYICCPLRNQYHLGIRVSTSGTRPAKGAEVCVLREPIES